MNNEDIAGRFRTWFMVSTALTMCLLAFKTCSILSERQEINPFFSIAQVAQGMLALAMIIWFFQGAYWRFDKWGTLCSASILSTPGSAIAAIYYCGILLSAYCCCCHSIGSILYANL